MKLRQRKVAPIVIKAPKKRHKELFSGAFKPRVEPANKKTAYKRKPKNRKGNLE